MKTSSGIKDLDRLIDSLHIGDNVIWEVEAGTSAEFLMNRFIGQSVSEGQNLIYVSFNRSPQSVLQQIGEAPSEGFVLIDCFTSGKGKNDKTFLKFYDGYPGKNVRRIERPSDIANFTDILNGIEDALPAGARYIFDSLTGMQDLWGEEQGTYKFFTYMCPRLYDLGTVAYWIIEKEAHSQAFRANLRHITQVVLELYKRKDHLYIKAHKLDGRHNREAFKPHPFRVEEGGVVIPALKKEPALNIGSKIKELRARLGLSQKELAEKVDLTPGFISQVENNQISPSLQSFLQIAAALGVSPGTLWDEARPKELPWLIKRQTVLSNPASRANGIGGFGIFTNGDFSGSLFVIEPEYILKRHLTAHRGKELIYVLSGSVSVTVEGNEVKLTEGDSVFLKEQQPTAWKNKGGDKAELLVICL